MKNDYHNFYRLRFLSLSTRAFASSRIVISPDVVIRGAEVNGQWHLADSWTVRGSLAYARGEDRIAATPLDSVDPLNAVIGLAYASVDGAWGMEGRLSAATRQKRLSDSGNTPGAGYGSVDLFGHYHLNERTTIRLGAFNLFDKQYALWNDLRGLAASDTDAIALAQQAGRQLRASVRMEFLRRNHHEFVSFSING